MDEPHHQTGEARESQHQIMVVSPDSPGKLSNHDCLVTRGTAQSPLAWGRSDHFPSSWWWLQKSPLKSRFSPLKSPMLAENPTKIHRFSPVNPQSHLCTMRLHATAQVHQGLNFALGLGVLQWFHHGLPLNTHDLLVLNVGNGWEWGLLGWLLLVMTWIIDKIEGSSSQEKLNTPNRPVISERSLISC